MVDEEKLKTYSKKYEEIKEEVVGASIIKGNLEKQQKITNTKIDKLSNDISDAKASLYFELVDHKIAKEKELEKNLDRNLVKNLLYGIVLFLLLYPIIRIPLILAIIFATIPALAQSIIDIRNYYASSKKLESASDYKIDKLKNEEISNLAKELVEELNKKKEIKKGLSIVNERINNLGEVKLDIENLIICLFSSLDNIIKNKSDQKKPFATWLNISYESDEPKLEISSTMKRVRNKKEDK